jgi:hypothetical protein
MLFAGKELITIGLTEITTKEFTGNVENPQKQNAKFDQNILWLLKKSCKF